MIWHTLNVSIRGLVVNARLVELSSGEKYEVPILSLIPDMSSHH